MSEMIGAWWALQGPSSFLSRVKRGLVDSKGRICVSSMPLDMPVELLSAVTGYLADELAVGRIIEVDASSEQSIPPVHQLSRAMGFSASPIRSVSDLASSDLVSDAIYVVHGINQANWMQWALFLQSFDHEVRRRDRLDAPRILILVPASVPEPELTALKQPLIRFMGVSSRLDTEQFVRDIWQHDRTSILSRVAMATAVEISGWDPRLAASFVDLDIKTMIEPTAWLKECSATLAKRIPSWADGLMDEWDGQPFVHSMIAAALGDQTIISRRIWLAQSRIILPLIDELRRRVVKRFKRELDALLPYDREYNGGRKQTIFSADRIELYDLFTKLEGHAQRDIIVYLMLMNKIRAKMAHLETADFVLVKAVSDGWQKMETHLLHEFHGWDWSRTGQKLIILVGPSCAGKSYYALETYNHDDVISSDAVRLQMFKSETVTGSQSVIFEKVREEAAKRLKSGRNAVIDATHLKAIDRMSSVMLAPPGIEVEYVVIDRPLDQKLSQAGWRARNPGMIEKQHDEFQSDLRQILAGDGLPNVCVRDLRTHA